MDIVEEIKKCQSDEELKALAEEAIELFTKEAQKDNVCTEFLGDKISYNPRFVIGDKDYYESMNIWNGYIPKGTKVVYARFKDDLVQQFTNNGYYYYIDDDSYVYDFFKFIKEEDIKDDYDIIVTVHKFIEDRFARYVNPKSRAIMHQLVHKDDVTYYPPVNEHKFSDFYYNGSAKCTEMAIMGQNLLSLLNFEMFYINDYNHAYNIYIPREGSEDEKDAFIVDFANFVSCYDVELNYLGKIPYLGKIKNFTEKFFEDFFSGKKRLKFPNYFLMNINNCTFEMTFGKDRDYGVDYIPIEEPKLLIKERKNKSPHIDF